MTLDQVWLNFSSTIAQKIYSEYNAQAIIAKKTNKMTEEELWELIEIVKSKSHVYLECEINSSVEIIEKSLIAIFAHHIFELSIMSEHLQLLNDPLDSSAEYTEYQVEPVTSSFVTRNRVRSFNKVDAYAKAFSVFDKYNYTINKIVKEIAFLVIKVIY